MKAQAFVGTIKCCYWSSNLQLMKLSRCEVIQLDDELQQRTELGVRVVHRPAMMPSQLEMKNSSHSGVK